LREFIAIKIRHIRFLRRYFSPRSFVVRDSRRTAVANEIK